MTTIRFTIAAMAVLLAGLGADTAMAQAKYPHATVTLVTHSSARGGSDVFLRALAKHLGPKMRVNFVVENVTGGSGARAVAKVAQAPADGSIFYATTPTYIQTTILSKPEFGYDSLAPVARVFLDPEVVYARAQSAHANLDVAVREAKRAIEAAFGYNIEDGIEVEHESWERVIVTQDRSEGIEAFNDKREPEWGNR